MWLSGEKPIREPHLPYESVQVSIFTEFYIYQTVSLPTCVLCSEALYCSFTHFGIRNMTPYGSPDSVCNPTFDQLIYQGGGMLPTWVDQLAVDGSSLEGLFGGGGAWHLAGASPFGPSINHNPTTTDR